MVLFSLLGCNLRRIDKQIKMVSSTIEPPRPPPCSLPQHSSAVTHHWQAQSGSTWRKEGEREEEGEEVRGRQEVGSDRRFPATLTCAKQKHERKVRKGGCAERSSVCFTATLLTEQFRAPRKWRSDASSSCGWCSVNFWQSEWNVFVFRKGRNLHFPRYLSKDEWFSGKIQDLFALLGWCLLFRLSFVSSFMRSY